MKKILQLTFICCVVVTSHDAAAQVLQQSKTTKGNVEMSLTNYGIYGLNVQSNSPGTFWPRGSNNIYIFGGGVWFAGLKLLPDATVPKKLAVISYNPNSGKSWMMPGRTEDPENNKNSDKYKMQSSVDYNADGTAKNSSGLRWPMWNTNGEILKNANFGSYIYTENDRSSAVYPKGAAFISDEDVISVFKDTDTSRYEIDSTRGFEEGLPLGLQIEQAVYSWDIGTPLQDEVMIRYTVINTSKDTLWECYLAPAVDADLAIKSNATNGATNDHASFLTERPDLETTVQWTDENQGEADQGFGYLGITLMETPAIDSYGFIRRDKAFYTFDEQIGLYTFRNWTIENDPRNSDERYDFMAAGTRDQDNGPGDKRILAATGPFAMAPGDTARVAVVFTFAERIVEKASSKDNEIASSEDFSKLIEKIETTRETLYKELISSVETENLLKETPAYISFKNDIATLNCKSDSFKNIRAELFNTLGERMMIIHNGDMATSEISFKTNELPAGMYYCVITSNGERITLPLTIVR